MSARDDILAGLRQADETFGDFTPEQLVDEQRMENRREAADWFASYPFPSSDSDWERGRDDALAWVVRCLRNPDPQRSAATGQGLDARLDEHRTMVLAEVTAWLIKKAREFWTSGNRRERERGDTAAMLASKIRRGAVRPDNLDMLPDAGFFEVDHAYVSGTWQFRCEAITPSPGTGEIRALGWKRSPVHDVHLWHAAALDPDDWKHGGWTDVTDGGEGR